MQALKRLNQIRYYEYYFKEKESYEYKEEGVVFHSPFLYLLSKIRTFNIPVFIPSL